MNIKNKILYPINNKYLILQLKLRCVLTLLTINLILFIFNLATPINLSAQIESFKKDDSFYFDAIVFNSSKNGFGKIDIFSIVPYKNLKFLSDNNKYISKYKLEITIYDNKSEIISTKEIPKKIIENDYFNTQSGKGNFDYNQISFDLIPGDYKIHVKINDEFSNVIEEKSKNISIVDFQMFPFSISGIMLLSDIEENNGKFKITPHISDNIALLNNGLFIFFEVYLFKNTNQETEDKISKTENNSVKKVDFFIKIFNEKNVLTKEYPKFTKEIIIDNKKNYIKKQLFYRIEDLKGIGSGNLSLKLYATNSTINPDYEESNLIAISQRSLKLEVQELSEIINNLDNSIKQLRYVATQVELDKIQNSTNEVEKLELFNSFWANLDPTKNTERNEAFEQYYERVKYANQNFKSYLEGWLCDKGQIYIVLGKPSNIERSEDVNRRIIYERWIYGSREFVFADNNGFGDFRLVRPYSFNEKYVYSE